MRVGAGIAGCAFLMLGSVTAPAADLGFPGAPPYGAVLGPVQPIIVVPACQENHSAVLMRCVPRREVFGPSDVDLIRIERSLGRRPVLPYKQLFTWP